MSEKLKISLPIIVEGRYDKSAISGYVDAIIVTTGGFSIFNNKEKQALIRKLSRDGIILLTDADGGGRQIRSFLQGIIPKEKIHNLHIPKIAGKERRKDKASRSGLLGVEGMERATIERLLSPFAVSNTDRTCREAVTRLDFFEDGLSGAENSTEKRKKLCSAMELPEDMTAKALLEAVNIFLTKEEYKQIINEINGQM